MELQRVPARQEYLLGVLAGILFVVADLFSIPGGVTVGHIALIVFFPLWLNAYLARKKGFFGPETLSKCVLILFCATALLFISVLSATYSDSPLRVGRVSMAMIAGISVFFFVGGTLTERRAVALIWLIVLSIAVVGLLSIGGLFNSFLHNLLYWEGVADRSSGTFKNPNQYGIAISTFLPVAAVLLLLSKGWSRLMAVVAMALLFCGLALSGSKTNLVLGSLSLAIGAIALAISLSDRDKRGTVLIVTASTVAVALAVIAFTLYALNPRSFDLLLQFFSNGLENRTVTSRQIIWARSLELFADHPFGGTGAGSPLPFKESRDYLSHSHNTFIDFARTLGAPGLVLIAGIYVTAFWASGLTILRVLTAETVDRRDLFAFALAIGSINYLLSNLMSDSFGPTTAPFFWLAFFLQFVFVVHRQTSPSEIRAVHVPLERSRTGDVGFSAE